MEILEPFRALSQSLVKKVDTMDTEADITDWVTNIIRVHGPTPELQPFNYDLPHSSEDIKANRLDPNSSNSESLFRVTLPQIMEAQKKRNPDLEVPLIVPVLIKALRDLGGVNMKGIFRISAGKDELISLRKQLEKGDFEVKVDSPHVPAGMLKEWLRELAEPLIPAELYVECVSAVRDMDQAPEIMSKSVVELFNRLPALTQKVIRTIGELLKEIAENSGVNLMTMDNLAIVFAPSLLRCPSDDPMELLQNSKFESRFTSILFRSL